MAIPLFKSVALGGSFASALNHLITAPSAVTLNDVMIAVLDVETAGNTVTPPTGWTSFFSAGVGTSFKMECFWKRATGAEPGTYTFAFASSQWGGGCIVAYSDCTASGSPIEVQNSGGTAATGISLTASSITTLENDTVVIYSNVTFDSVLSVPPSGMTERADKENIEIAELSFPTAGATGDKIGIEAGVTNGYVTFMFSLKGSAAAASVAILFTRNLMGVGR